MFILPYLLLKKRLEEIPELKIIDLDLGQGTANYKGGLTNQPAVLISFNDVDFNSLGSRQQMGILEVELKLITDVSHKDDRLLTEGKPINHFALAEEIFKKLHAWRGILVQLDNFEQYGNANEVVFGSLQRNNIGYKTNTKSLFASTQSFSATVKEVSANPILTRLPNNIVPINLILPIVTADYNNNLLTVDPGNWFSNSEIAYSYQWYQNNELVNGATELNLAFSEADNESTYTCKVTATNSIGDTSIDSIEHKINIPEENNVQSLIYESGIYETGIYQ